MNQNAHILVAEDDFEDRYMMAESFRELGHSEQIKFTEDGNILLDYLYKSTNEKIGLIVLDLDMPQMNGTETLRALKSDVRYNHIPVIIFSTSVNEIEKGNCMQLGAHSYITKPHKWDVYLDTCKMMFNISCEA
jgi:CheY-like chemotaxis protein